MVQDFGVSLKHSITLQKSVPDFIEGLAFIMKITVEPLAKGGIRLRLLPDIIMHQSDTIGRQKIEGYSFREEKLEGQELIRYLQQVDSR
jgi:hypothetical protein